MLIIDGPDNIGKTTLARHLVKKATERLKDFAFECNECQYRHMTRPSDDFDYFLDYKSLCQNSMFTVQDRFHFGTLAYDDPCKYNGDQLRIIESWLYSQGSYIIVMIPDKLDKYAARLENYAKEEMFERARNVKAASIYIDIAIRSAEVPLAMSPSIDCVIEQPLHSDGSVNDEDRDYFTWNNALDGIIDSWFQRIELARKGVEL